MIKQQLYINIFGIRSWRTCCPVTIHNTVQVPRKIHISSRSPAACLQASSSARGTRVGARLRLYDVKTVLSKKKFTHQTLFLKHSGLLHPLLFAFSNLTLICTFHRFGVSLTFHCFHSFLSLSLSVLQMKISTASESSSSKPLKGFNSNFLGAAFAGGQKEERTNTFIFYCKMVESRPRLSSTVSG